MSPLERLINRHRIRLLAFLSLGIGLVGIGLISWLVGSQIRRHDIRIAGGVEGLDRHAIAKYLKRHANDLGLQIEVIPSEGTIQATQMVEDRQVDFALVNGLIQSPQAVSVRQVAVVSMEKLHLLAKQEYAQRLADDLSELEHVTIFAGREGGETELIGRALLEFCGIEIGTSDNSLTVDRRTLQDLLKVVDELPAAAKTDKDLTRNSLPDVVLHVSTLPSQLARKLILYADYELVPLPFSDAFSRITVEEEELDRDHIDQVLVDPAVIPAYMYGAAPPVPERDSPTLGCPLVLIASKDAPVDAVSRLLPAIFRGPVERVYQPPALSDADVIYPLHPASISYRDRDKPLLRADVVEAIRMIFGIIAPMVGGCFALIGFYRWRHTLRFLGYFEQLQKLDRQAKGLVSDDIVTPAEAEDARRLEAKLTVLQHQAVSDFCKNHFYADGVLETFLQLLSETRNFLRTTVGQPTTEDFSRSNLTRND